MTNEAHSAQESLDVNWLIQVFTSSIGKKFLAALSGLALVGFCVSHLLGNLTLFTGGPSGLDAYAEDLHHLPGFVFAEIGLIGMFVLHIVLVVGLVMSNKAARASRYAVSASKREDSASRSLASRTMKYSGMALLAFLILHILHFRLKRGEFHAADGSVSGLGLEVIAVLSNPAFAAIYVAGSLLVAWHIFHGFQSAFRSVGFNHPKYRSLVELASAGIAGIIGLGFSLFPIAAQLGYFDDAGAAEVVEEGDGEATHEEAEEESGH